MLDLASLDWLQGFLLVLVKAVCEAVVEVWKEVLVSTAEELARQCPRCGQRRKWKWRRKQCMKVSVLGLDFELPKPYVECGHCDAPGVSVVKLLTGLRSGDSSAELELLAGHCASQASYRKAARNLKAHHGQEVERTKVRRMALKVEGEVVVFVEEQRREAEARGEAARGPERLLEQADGGMIRSGILEPCQEGDEGYGKKTPMRGLPRRKRPVQYRELITFDVRVPGEGAPRALDVMMPVLSPEGERGRRMRAMALRAGLGSNTKMNGLGDMGSGLAPAFEDVFKDHHGFWEADWTHTDDYVKKAVGVLSEMDTEGWKEQMRAAIWDRDAAGRDILLLEAFRHRVHPLPAKYEKCPLHALQVYLKNNWKHLRFKEMEALGLPIVSARAESQVRDRTKDRFSVPGAWLEENLEPKASLRSIIDEGSWDEFRAYVHQQRQSAFRQQLVARLEAAVREGRLDRAELNAALHSTGPPVDKEEPQDDDPAETIALAA